MYNQLKEIIFFLIYKTIERYKYFLDDDTFPLGPSETYL